MRTQEIATFVSRIDELREKYAARCPLPSLVVAGACNAGKSTLINALLKDEITPVDVLPATACPIVFRYGQNFSALLIGKQRKLQTTQRQELARLLRQQSPRNIINKVEITLNNPWLKKCLLIDTPGIDAPGQDNINWFRKIITGTGLILYLFHQRGLDDRDRRFLYQLKGGAFPQEYGRVSFWINSNLGYPDGSALMATRIALGEIFGKEIPVNHLDTRNKKSVSILRQFVELELAALTIRQVENVLQEEDKNIPRQLAKAVSIPEDNRFLCFFWDTYQKALGALEFQQQLQMLPGMRSLVRQQLSAYNEKIYHFAVPPSRSIDEGWKAVNLSLLKERLINLLHRLLADPALKQLPQRQSLRELTGSVAQDTFFVTIWGPFSSGKSTFLNAVMQEAILPAQDQSTTSCLTRLHYGPEKLAVAHFPLQVILPISNEHNEEVFLCREELAAVDSWLREQTFLTTVREIEVLIGGKFSRVDLSQLNILLDQTRAIFAPTPFSLSPGIQSRVPAITRPVSRKRAARAVRAIRLSFKNAVQKTYQLANPEDLERFKKLITSPTALRLEGIDIFYPAELFKLATFVDTPGIDSVHARHLKTVTDWVIKSDIHMIFLNGRHILSAPHRDVILKTLGGRLTIPKKSNKGEERRQFPENCLFAINFADTLNRNERERVANFLRRELTSSSQISYPMPRMEIHWLSALSALQGKDDGTFKHFLNRLERAILIHRGEEVLSRRIQQVKEQLLTDTGIPPETERLLAKYRQELEEIQRMLKIPGGYRLWKMPASWKKG